MIDNTAISTPETLYPINSKAPLNCSTAAKAFKYGMYGAVTLGFGYMTVSFIDLVQSHFDKPSRDFLYDQCLANATNDTRDQYGKLLIDHHSLSFFAKSVISGSIIAVAHVFLKTVTFMSNKILAQPAVSNTVNQPTHRPSAEEMTSTNELSAMV